MAALRAGPDICLHLLVEAPSAVRVVAPVCAVASVCAVVKREPAVDAIRQNVY